jgi:hypothetical protein
VLSGRRFFSAAIASSLGFAAFGAGCGSSRRPPPLGDTLVESGTGIFVPPASSGPPMCNLAAGGGGCECVDQSLLGTPPNLYFVLDRSASMSENGKWPTIVSVVTEMVVALGPRVNVGVAVFPSPRNASDGCGAGVEIVPLVGGDSPAGTVGPVATAILNSLGRVGAAGGTPTAATLEALQPGLATLPGKTYVVLATDGGPNCNPTAACTASECEANIEGAAGCNPATNCCMESTFGPVACLDAAPTVQAVDAIARGGTPVYVVGVPGSAPYAALLDQLALSGGTARNPTGTGPQYYDVRTADRSAFEAALFQVAARVAGTCTLQLSQAPSNPGRVNVFLDEQPLPTGAGCVLGDDGGVADPGDAAGDASGDAVGDAVGDAASDGDDSASASDDATPDAPLEAATTSTDASVDLEAETASSPPGCAWTLRGPTVTILGDACQWIMGGDVLDVRVVVGCPTVIR